MINKIGPSDNLEGKRILITGGLGFIGSNLACQCLKLGADVTIFDSLDSFAGGNLYNIHDFQDSVRLIRDDIRNFEALNHALCNQDIVFHCAAYTSHIHSMNEPFVNVDVNCKGVLNLLDAARRYGEHTKVIYVGTSTQIGKLQLPLSVSDELHPEFPMDIYSANKMVAEKYTLIYHNAFGVRTTVVRLPNVFGPRACIKTPAFGFINYFIGVALQNKPITVYGQGRQKRNFCFVDDAVEALLVVATSDRSDGEVFIAAHDEHYSVAEMTTMVTESIGGKVEYIPWPAERAAIEVGDVLVSNQKIKTVLGWKPRYDISMGLKLTKDYYNECLEKYLS